MRDKISEKLGGGMYKITNISAAMRPSVSKLGAKSMLRHSPFTLSSALKNSYHK